MYNRETVCECAQHSLPTGDRCTFLWINRIVLRFEKKYIGCFSKLMRYLSHYLKKKHLLLLLLLLLILLKWLLYSPYMHVTPSSMFYVSSSQLTLSSKTLQPRRISWPDDWMEQRHGRTFILWSCVYQPLFCLVLFLIVACSVFLALLAW